MTKICGIGLGKRDGAEEYHSRVFDVGLPTAIRSAAEQILASGKILGGLGVIENAYHDTARLVGVRLENFFEHEAQLLQEAKQLMPRLPLDQLHVLFCDQMGKNVSGTGLDTNIIGRSVRGYRDTEAWQEDMPVIRRIAVNDVTVESDGNATGLGLIDFITARFHQHIDYYVTSMNVLISKSVPCGKTPLVMRNTEQMLAWAIKSSGGNNEEPCVVYIRDTLDLSNMLVSEACVPLLENRDGLEVLPEAAQPLEFDEEGYIRSPFLSP